MGMHNKISKQWFVLYILAAVYYISILGTAAMLS